MCAQVKRAAPWHELPESCSSAHLLLTGCSRGHHRARRSRNRACVPHTAAARWLLCSALLGSIQPSACLRQAASCHGCTQQAVEAAKLLAPAQREP